MLWRALRNVRDGLLSLTYPESCRLCGGPINSWDDGVVCAPCWEDPDVTITFNGLLICPKCGIPIQGRPRRSVEKYCALCESLPFSAARSAGLYTGALEAAILQLKTHPHICRRLRILLEQTYASNFEALSSDIIIPIPLHKSRLRERGFNQAFLIAKTISSFSRIPIAKKVLFKVKYTERHRAGMDSIDRARSVADAFQIKNNSLINGAAVLLVDDLYTTGSTVSAASGILLEAGAVKVSVFTAARAKSQISILSIARKAAYSSTSGGIDDA